MTKPPKTMEEIRDEAADNAWLSPDIQPSTPTDSETFLTIFKAGFDAALKAIAQIEFDEKTAYEKQISRDRDYDDFVYGARWQLERIKELCK